MTIDNSRSLVVQQGGYEYDGVPGDFIPIPDMLNLNSIFVSDYYQWSDKLALLGSTNGYDKYYISEISFWYY